ncbi:MAG: ABC transporter permease [Ignavibacteriaceae bacterium]|nr:ABC transporter permease [Ignavibacteriaceae bacterium]
MNLNRIKAIAKKEFKHLLRDYRMLAILVLFPVFLLGIFGYAINFDVHHIKLAVYDQEYSIVTRDLVKGLTNSEYFDLTGYLNSDHQLKTTLDNKLAQCIVVIPSDFSRKFYSRQNVKVQFLIDGVDGNTANIIQNYVTAALQTFGQNLTAEVLMKNGQKNYVPIDLETRFWYNPDLQTTRFLLPGLIAMILLITAAISVSLSLVREKERGTIEQINVSPINSFELIAGKILPYLLLSLFNAAVILIVGYFLFGVEIKGSIILLFLTTLLFLSASTGIGILVSVIADSQQVAFSIATFATLLPSVILSGFIFPIESMPLAVQILTNITPAKFFIEILRAIVIRGVGITSFWDQALYLLLFTTVIILLADLINTRKGNKG